MIEPSYQTTWFIVDLGRLPCSRRHEQTWTIDIKESVLLNPLTSSSFFQYKKKQIQLVEAGKHFFIMRPWRTWDMTLGSTNIYISLSVFVSLSHNQRSKVIRFICVDIIFFVVIPISYSRISVCVHIDFHETFLWFVRFIFFLQHLKIINVWFLSRLLLVS